MSRNDQQDRQGRVPENDPSKAMDSKREVEQSNDSKTDQDFPGYPHYPAKEDIMDQRTDSHRVDLDVEKIPTSNATGFSQRYLADQKHGRVTDADEAQPEPEGGDFPPSDEAATLDTANAEIGTPQNVSNEDLDQGPIPGTDTGREEPTDESTR